MLWLWRSKVVREHQEQKLGSLVNGENLAMEATDFIFEGPKRFELAQHLGRMGQPPGA